jgi:hypothetical protein
VVFTSYVSPRSSHIEQDLRRLTPLTQLTLPLLTLLYLLPFSTPHPVPAEDKKRIERLRSELKPSSTNKAALRKSIETLLRNSPKENWKKVPYLLNGGTLSDLLAITMMRREEQVGSN